MAAKSSPTGRPGIQSVEVAAVILDALSEGGASMPLKNLAEAAGMHPGKVHRYLVSLTRTGLVEQDAATGHYAIGPLALKIGLVALRNIDVVRYASSELPALRDRINETAVLAVWGNLGPTVVGIAESGQAVTMNLRIGTVLPVMGTAIGQVFAAFLPESTVKEVIRRQRNRVAGVEEAAKLGDAAAVLEQIRARGLARIDGTLVPGVAALAVPIFDYGGSVAAVLASLGRDAEFDSAWDGSVAQALTELATDISRRLGHTG